MGEVIPFPAPRRGRYDRAGLDRLLAEIDRRRELRAVGDDAPRVRRPVTAVVVPFRFADR